jgi:hypothetical protein
MSDSWEIETPHFTCERRDEDNGFEFDLIITRRADGAVCWIRNSEGGSLLFEMLVATPPDAFIEGLLARAFTARATIPQPTRRRAKAA